MLRVMLCNNLHLGSNKYMDIVSCRAVVYDRQRSSVYPSTDESEKKRAGWLCPKGPQTCDTSSDNVILSSLTHLRPDDEPGFGKLNLFRTEEPCMTGG